MGVFGSSDCMFYRGQFVLTLPNWRVGVFRKGGTISIYNLLKILLWRKKKLDSPGALKSVFLCIFLGLI